MFSRQVDDYLSVFSIETQKKVNVLRELILDAAPMVEESLKFGIPFYTLHGFLAFITIKKDKIIVGLCDGVSLVDEEKKLSAQYNKQVRHFAFDNFNQDELDYLRYFILQHCELNLAKFKEKSSKKRKL